MKLGRWSRYGRWPPAAQAMLWLAFGFAMYADWVWLSHPELLDQVPHALVYRAGFAGGIVTALFWWMAIINDRVHKLERRIEVLERERSQRE